MIRNLLRPRRRVWTEDTHPVLHGQARADVLAASLAGLFPTGTERRLHSRVRLPGQAASVPYVECEEAGRRAGRDRRRAATFSRGMEPAAASPVLRAPFGRP